MERSVRLARAEDSRSWPGSSQALRRDGLGAHFETMVVRSSRIEALGGHCIRGQAVRDPAVLSGAGVRAVLSSMPERSWNDER